jgi:glycosyltransferase involved in cell wall biosynthesis
MRVVIDAVPLLIRSAGVKNYLYYWIDSLRRAAGPGQIRTFPALDDLGGLNHDGSVAGPWRTGLGLAELALANFSPLPVLDFLCRGADLFHASALVRRPPARVRLTATIHDMTCFLMPELHPASNLRADQNYAALMRRADGLIAVSECTKQDAMRVLGIPEDRITVIHSGIAPAFFNPPADEITAVRKRYGLARPFVLFVGTIEPRKNLGTLLDAFEALPRSIREEFDLVVVGPAGWAPAETRARLERVRYLGYVPEADIAPITAAATVFAYPSLYEGFGFPVAQAMAAGVPVVTSNVSSLPEIAGDAALLVDPRSPSELREALARLLLSISLRMELAGRGRTRAEAFRWETCAAKSLEFFKVKVETSHF